MMRSLRVPVSGLMVLVLACGIGFGALRHPTPLRAAAVSSAAALTLLGATLAALRGRSRSFWIGFAVFGWGYALLAMSSLFPGVSSHLLTTSLIDFSFPRVIAATDLHSDDSLIPVPYAQRNLVLTAPGALAGIREYRDFVWIGHWLCCILIGGAGAIFSLVLADRRGDGASS
jgi:hypothetical protein